MEGLKKTSRKPNQREEFGGKKMRNQVGMSVVSCRNELIDPFPHSDSHTHIPWPPSLKYSCASVLAYYFCLSTFLCRSDSINLMATIFRSVWTAWHQLLLRVRSSSVLDVQKETSSFF